MFGGSLPSALNLRFRLSSGVRRAVTSLWFAAFGLALGLLFTLHGPVAWRALLLFVALPVLSGGVAGFLWGSPLLDVSTKKTAADALLRGGGVAAGAFAIFSFCFALLLPVLEAGWSRSQVPALFFTVLTLGLLAVGPLVVVSGLIAGVALHALARWAASSEHNLPGL